MVGATQRTSDPDQFFEDARVALARADRLYRIRRRLHWCAWIMDLKMRGVIK